MGLVHRSSSGLMQRARSTRQNGGYGGALDPMGYVGRRLWRYWPTENPPWVEGFVQQWDPGERGCAHRGCTPSWCPPACPAACRACGARLPPAGGRGRLLLVALARGGGCTRAAALALACPLAGPEYGSDVSQR